MCLCLYLYMFAVMYVCLLGLFYLCSDTPCFRVLLRAFVCACVLRILVYARMLVVVEMSLRDVNVCALCARLVTLVSVYDMFRIFVHACASMVTSLY